MRVFSAPGIVREEIDQSSILIPTGISNGAIVIKSSKGPINRAVSISHDQSFINTFGEPYFVSGTNSESEIPELGYGSYAALEFLKESKNLYVMRSCTSGATGADAYAAFETTKTSASVGLSSATSAVSIPVTTHDYSSNPDTTTKINIINDYASSSNSKFVVSTLYPAADGTNGNNVAFTIEPINSACDWLFAYDTLPTFASAAYLIKKGGDSSATAYLPIAKKVFKLNVYVKSSTEKWTDFETLSADTTNGYLRITPTETFYGTCTAQLDGNKKQLFIEDVVNGNSSYIYVKVGSSFTGPFDYEAVTTQLPTQTDTNGKNFVPYSLLRQLGGGNTIYTDTGISYGSDMANAWNFFKNREYVNVNILINPSWNTALKQHVASIAASRMDCIAVNQSGRLTHEATDSITVDNVLNDEEYGYQEPSYVALYCGYSKIYDKYNDKYVFLPNAIYGAMLMARGDNRGNPWDAPAGTNRAVMPVLDQRKIWAYPDDIGKLYDKNINAVRFIKNIGFCMWGQKTAQLKHSALDRINVRRNLLFIENNIEASLVQFLFENNTDRTRLRVYSLVQEFLDGIVAGGGLYAGKVVVDKSNNTSTIIDSNQLKVDIYLQPTKTIEWILMTTIITRTGISFSTVQI